jgi:hypothetical protein
MLALEGPAKFALALLIGGGLGLATATRSIDGGFAGISSEHGQWVTWPAAGRKDEDPYTRAHFVLDGRLPVSAFEAAEFETASDSTGATLDADCTYILEGRLPPSRWWSVWTAPAAAPGDGVTSQAAVLEPDGGLRVAFSRAAQPGNWIRLSADADRFRVFLRLYASGAPGRGGAAASLPVLRLEHCL